MKSYGAAAARLAGPLFRALVFLQADVNSIEMKCVFVSMVSSRPTGRFVTAWLLFNSKKISNVDGDDDVLKISLLSVGV